MAERRIGVNKTYLIERKNGTIVRSIEFIDDYRPALSIDRRYAKIDFMGGCVWYSDRKNFSTKEEGNEFYNQLKAEGCVAGTEVEVDQFIRRCGNLTY